MMQVVIPILGFLYLVLSLLAAGHALLNKRDSRSALGWTLTCLFLPYVGPLVYAMFGINRIGVRARKKRPQSDDLGVTFEADEPRIPEHFDLALIGKNVTGKPLLPCNSISCFENGDELYPAMLESIKQARDSVYLATYIFKADQTGKKFITALADARARGVDIKIIIDGLGEYIYHTGIARALRKAGLPFRRFNPVSLLPPSFSINMRNHRKLLVIDGHTAYTGGMNIAQYHIVGNLEADPEDARRVMDIHFCLQGAIAADLEYAFVKDWDFCSGQSLAADFKPRVSYQPAETWTRLILDGPNEYLDKLSDVLVSTISAARKRVWIMTPYFLPDGEIIGALQAARLRNLDVRVVLPGENNVHMSHWATRNLLWQLLDKKIDIYYQDPPFDHSKLLLIDDDYCLIGSANIDPRSLRLNFELSVEIFSQPVNEELSKYFHKKFIRSKIFTRNDLHSRSLPIRLRDATAWLFTPFL